MFDCITIGDATLDRFLLLSEIEVREPPQEGQRRRLCTELGTKIPVDDLHEDIGGNACNVAFGLDCLGRSTALYTSLGSDYNGRRVLERLSDSNVDQRFVSVNSDERTNSATILSFEHERSIFSYKAPSTYVKHALPETKWIYLTSLGEGCEDLIEHTRDFCEGGDTKLAFNPGSYFMYHKLNLIRDSLPSIDLLILNKEEAQDILESEETDPKHLMRELMKRGSDAIALTDGTKGAYAALGDTCYFAPSLEVPVEEVTGAGDAFSSGFLAYYINDASLTDCLKAGIYNAAGAIQDIGATRGILCEEEMNTQFQENPIDVEEL